MKPSFETCVIAALTVSIVLWKEATPKTQFPSIEELVRIELGRILAQKDVRSKHRLSFAPSTMVMLRAEPWDVSVSALLDGYKNDVVKSGANIENVGEDLLRFGHMDMFMLPPKVRSVNTEGDLADLVADVGETLNVTQDGTLETARNMAYETYTGVHNVMTRKSVFRSQ
jgi:hypothetical protein